MVVGGGSAGEQGWAGTVTYSVGWQWAEGSRYVRASIKRSRAKNLLNSQTGNIASCSGSCQGA